MECYDTQKIKRKKENTIKGRQSTFFVFFLCAILAHTTTLVFAQSWDLKGVKTVKQIKAELVSIHTNYYQVTFKVLNDKQTASYELGSCLVDDKTYITRNQKKIKLSDLKEGEKVVVRSIIYENGLKSCQSVSVQKN